MAPLSQDSIYRVVAIEEGEQRLPSSAKPVQSAPDLWVAARRGEPLLEHVRGILETAGLLVDLRQI